MANGNKIIYRNDFNPGEVDYGEPGTCTISYQGNQKIYRNLLGVPEEWNKNGSLCDKSFEAKKGLSVEILVKIDGVDGSPGAWPDMMIGCVVDSDSMPDLYNATALGAYVAANSFIHPFAGGSTGLTVSNTKITGGVSLGQFYKTKIEIGNDGKASIYWGDQLAGQTNESVLGKMLRPYRSAFTAGALLTVDSLIVRA